MKSKWARYMTQYLRSVNMEVNWQDNLSSGCSDKGIRWCSCVTLSMKDLVICRKINEGADDNGVEYELFLLV